MLGLWVDGWEYNLSVDTCVPTSSPRPRVA